MDVHGRSRTRGDPKHFNDFPIGGSLRIGWSRTHTQRTAFQAYLNLIQNGGELGACGLSVSGVTTGQEVSSIMHNHHAHRNVPDADTVVDARLSGKARVPSVDVSRAHLHFQRSCYSVSCLNGVVLRILAVLVKINEAWRDDQSMSVDGLFAPQNLVADFHDFAAANSNVSNGVKTGLGIHRATAKDHYVERRRLAECRTNVKQCVQDCAADQPEHNNCSANSLHANGLLCGVQQCFLTSETKCQRILN